MLRHLSLACGLLLAPLLGAALPARTLKQEDGGFSLQKPLSATPDMLLGDPAGRAHLLAALGNPPEYFGAYPYPWPEGEYNIDPRIDPAVVSPIPGNQSPSNGSYEVVGNSGMIAVHAIPFPNGEYLVYGRPAEPYGGGDPAGPGVHWLSVDGGEWSEIAAIYNANSATFEPFHIPEAPFCGAQTLLPDGRAILVGGEHVNVWYPHLQYGQVAVRIYDPATHVITTVNTMQRGRWYPSVMTMADGNVLIVGGGQQEIGGWSVSDSATSPLSNPDYPTEMLIGKCVPNGGGGAGDPYWDNPSYTIYDVNNNTLTPDLTLTILLEAFPINLYPVLFVMPTGSTLIIAGVQVAAMYFTPEGVTADAAVGPLPSLPRPIGANQYTPVAILTLSPPNYEVYILVAGGTGDYCPNTKSPASNESSLIDATPGADHSLITEEMSYRRIMGDLVLLPDGRVFLCNGAQIGLGGGGGPRYSNMKDPTTIAEIYDPSQPIGERWSPVGDSQIPRLYHSVAVLTPNATVMISGSETTSERRVQIYTPDYLLTGKPRPVITSAPSNVGYNASFEVAYSNVTSIERVVLSRPASATHGVHFDARTVELDFLDSGNGQITCIAPPTNYLAPPGQYMLFILGGGVPSVATYITVPEPESFYLSADAPAPLYGLEAGLTGGITGPTSASLAVEGPNYPSVIEDAPTPGTTGYTPANIPENPDNLQADEPTATAVENVDYAAGSSAG